MYSKGKRGSVATHLAVVRGVEEMQLRKRLLSYSQLALRFRSCSALLLVRSLVQASFSKSLGNAEVARPVPVQSDAQMLPLTSYRERRAQEPSMCSLAVSE